MASRQRPPHVLFWGVILLIGLPSLYLFLLAFSPSMRLEVERVVRDHFVALGLVGSAGLLVSGFLAWIFFRLAPRRVLHLTMGCSVDTELVEQWLEPVWRELFPDGEVNCSVHAGRGERLIVSLELPDIPLDERKKWYDQIDQKVSEVLQNKLGYNRTFLCQIEHRTC